MASHSRTGLRAPSAATRWSAVIVYRPPGPSSVASTPSGPACRSTSSVPNLRSPPRATARSRGAVSSRSWAHRQGSTGEAATAALRSPGGRMGSASASTSVRPARMPWWSARSAAARSTSAVMPSDQKTSMVRKLKRRALGCGEVLRCFSTRTDAVPYRVSRSEGARPVRPPPTMRTGVRVMCVQRTRDVHRTLLRTMSSMLVWSLPEPGRGPQPALGRNQIVRAAIKIADTEGVAAATMRRVATALGSSTPMSLYRYVGNKDGLVDLMLDAVLAEVAVPAEPTGDWRADLRLLALESWAMMQRHPWYAELVHTRPPLGPQALARTEFGLAALTGTGIDPTTAMTYLGMVNGLTIGIALQANEELKMRRRTGLHTDDDLRAAAQPFIEEIIAGGKYPTVNRWLAAGGGFGDGFDAVLDTMLDGIAAQLP